MSPAAQTIVTNFDGQSDIRIRDVMSRCGMSEQEACIACSELRSLDILSGEYTFNHFFHIDSSRPGRLAKQVV